jgi:S-DNA-T family DNA segregation ATPase FtsK/SpoIIIE
VVLAGLALLGVTAMLFPGGPLLDLLRGGLLAAFGAGWPLPVAAALGLGGLWVWPRSPRLRAATLAAGLVSALALLGLLGMSAGSAGGAVGQTVALPLSVLVGPIGGRIVLGLGLVLGLIVAFRFSPGALALRAVTAARAAYAERQRIERLVRRARPEPAVDRPPPPAPPPVTGPIDRAPHPAEPAPASLAPALAPLPEREWRPEPPIAAQPAIEADGRAAPAAPPDGPALQIDPDAEDDLADIDWELPSYSLLDSLTARRERIQVEIKRNVHVIEDTLRTFGVHARVIGVNSGPSVTQYELQPAAGVPVKRIVSLQNDLSLALAAAPLRIEAPIPGKSAVGIEVPNKAAVLVPIRAVVETPFFRDGGQALALALGNDVAGRPVTTDLTRMPHLLIAGATGQGKSVCINVLICSLLLQHKPTQLRLVMIDPKRVELQSYGGLPHLAVPVIVEAHQAAAALRWAVAEMDRRYRLLSAEGVRNIAGYNEKAVQQRARELPYVVIVIDELADLMMVAAGEIEELVCRIAQLARAVGIHLVIATQRPSTDIITGLIKANIPSRIAFAVGSQVDSRVILDTTGAEKLLGRGDMLYQPVDAGKPIRVQGAFISDREVDGLVQHWRRQGEPHYMEEVLEGADAQGVGAGGESDRRLDPLFARAARAVAAEGAASVSLVQRKFNVGYSRAGRIVDQLAEHRVIGGYQGSKSREVLMNLPDVDELLERLGLEG